MINEVKVRCKQIEEIYDIIKKEDEEFTPYPLEAYYGHTLIL
jgi:hypothetical protein